MSRDQRTPGSGDDSNHPSESVTSVSKRRYKRIMPLPSSSDEESNYSDNDQGCTKRTNFIVSEDENESNGDNQMDSSEPVIDTENNEEEVNDEPVEPSTSASVRNNSISCGQEPEYPIEDIIALVKITKNKNGKEVEELIENKKAVPKDQLDNLYYKIKWSLYPYKECCYYNIKSFGESMAKEDLDELLSRFENCGERNYGFYEDKGYLWPMYQEKNKRYAYCYSRHGFYIDETLPARAPISGEHLIKQLGGLCILNFDCKGDGVFVQPNFTLVNFKTHLLRFEKFIKHSALYMKWTYFMFIFLRL